jgi:hypothetical protein
VEIIFIDLESGRESGKGRRKEGVRRKSEKTHPPYSFFLIPALFPGRVKIKND